MIEPLFAGHRLWYVRMLATRLAEAGLAPVIVTTPEAIGSQEWATHIADSWQVTDLPAQDSLRHFYRAAIAKVPNGDVVALPDGDDAITALATLPLSPRRRIAVLVMRPYAGPGARSRIAHVAKTLLIAASRLRSRLSIFYLSAPAAPRSLLPLVGATPVHDVQQFSPRQIRRDAWLSRHAVPPDAPTYLIAGAVTARKSAPGIIQRFGSQDTEAVLVVVGRCDAAVSQAIDELPTAARERLRVFDNYVSDEDLDTWIASCDVMLLTYRNLGSSGLLLKALSAATPCIVLDGSHLHDAAREVGLAHVAVRYSSGVPMVTFTEHKSTSALSDPVKIDAAHSFPEPLVRSLL